MDDDVDAEFQRPLQIGAAEGVVGDRDQAAAPGKRGDAFEVDDAQQRVGRRLDPQHFRLRPDRRLDGGKVGEVDEADLQPGRALAHPFEQPERAAIDVVGGDDVGAAVEQFEHRGDAGEARGEGEAGACRFRGRRCALEGEARGVLAAGILEALVNAGALCA